MATGFTASLDLSTLDGTNGFRLDGVDAFDASGYSVSAAGDVDGDGFDDLIIGALGADPGGDLSAGESYVIFGRKPDVAVNLTGTNTAQTLAGGDFNDVLRGLAGNDRLFGHGGNDVLDGGTGGDAMIGGTGNDTYFVDTVADAVIEGAGGGTDTVFSRISTVLANNVENGVLELNLFTNLFGNALSNNLMGNGGNNILSGLNGNDILSGGNGNDRLLGGNGNDILVGGAGNDFLLGGNNNDVLFGGNDNDRLSGDNGNDRLFGGNQNDVLIGGNGIDTLRGDAGNDILIGGRQRDILIGGDGADDFDYNNVSESGKTPGTRDRILDFQHLIDDIDLRTIDADITRPGNQRFRFIGQQDFHDRAGELRFEKINRPGVNGDRTMIEGDINGDGVADFQIELIGLVNLSNADFFL